MLQFYFTAWFLDGKFSQIATEGLSLQENQSVLPILSECRLDLWVNPSISELIRYCDKLLIE